MPGQVKVEDFEVFTLFRVAMLKFAQAAEQSLSNADSEIARTHAWLENEQASFWHGQLRKRTEAVTKAREELRQKKLFKDSSGRTPDAPQEEKMLSKCLAAMAEAEEKIQAVRKWLPKLEKASDIFRGSVSPLNRTITGDIPRAVALLDRLSGALQEYVQIEAPEVRTVQDEAPEESAGVGAADPLMGRGGDAPAPPVETAPAAEKAENEAVKKAEAGDVTDGQ